MSIITGEIVDYLKGVPEEYIEDSSAVWQQNAPGVMYAAERVTYQLKDILEDDRLQEFVFDFVDDIIYEYVETGEFGKAFQDFKLFVIETVEAFEGENSIELDVDSLVESILNGARINDVVLFEGARKVKLKG